MRTHANLPRFFAPSIPPPIKLIVPIEPSAEVNLFIPVKIPSSPFIIVITASDFAIFPIVSAQEFFNASETKELIQEFKSAGLNLTSNDDSIDNRFKGMTFVLTGTLDGITRDEASKIIEQHGGKTSSSVSKKTTYVLAGSDAGSKLTKAQTLGISVISLDEFFNMLK